MDRTQELQHLALADEHIAAGEQRIAELEVLIGDIDQRLHDSTQAVRLLKEFKDTLAEWIHHRDLIVLRLAEGD